MDLKQWRRQDDRKKGDQKMCLPENINCLNPGNFNHLSNLGCVVVLFNRSTPMTTPLTRCIERLEVPGHVFKYGKKYEDELQNLCPFEQFWMHHVFLKFLLMRKDGANLTSTFGEIVCLKKFCQNESIPVKLKRFFPSFHRPVLCLTYDADMPKGISPLFCAESQSHNNIFSCHCF